MARPRTAGSFDIVHAWKYHFFIPCTLGIIDNDISTAKGDEGED